MHAESHLVANHAKNVACSDAREAHCRTLEDHAGSKRSIVLENGCCLQLERERDSQSTSRCMIPVDTMTRSTRDPVARARAYTRARH